MWITIAIDGPAASGKRSVSIYLAWKLDLFHLDTGMLFRLAAYTLRDTPPEEWEETLREMLRKYDPLELSEQLARKKDLRSEEAGAAASRIGQNAVVRRVLREYEINLIHNPIESYSGALLDGRDITSVIAPDAMVKIFLTASLEERAKRRAEQLGKPHTVSSVLKVLRKRDREDKERNLDPLKLLPDVYLLDTTNLSLAEARDAAYTHCLACLPESIGPKRSTNS